MLSHSLDPWIRKQQNFDQLFFWWIFKEKGKKDPMGKNKCKSYLVTSTHLKINDLKWQYRTGRKFWSVYLTSCFKNQLGGTVKQQRDQPWERMELNSRAVRAAIWKRETENAKEDRFRSGEASASRKNNLAETLEWVGGRGRKNIAKDGS